MMVVRELDGDERGLGVFFFFSKGFRVSLCLRGVQATGQATGDDESRGVRRLSFFL